MVTGALGGWYGPVIVCPFANCRIGPEYFEGSALTGPAEKYQTGWPSASYMKPTKKRFLPCTSML